MLVIEICERFGWTYWEYMLQPSWFVDLIKDKFYIEGQRETNKLRNLEQK